MPSPLVRCATSTMAAGAASALGAARRELARPIGGRLNPSMESALLQRLLSFENAFNKRFAPVEPLYKFHRLYEDRAHLADAERASQHWVENADKNGFHVLNPFFVSLLERRSIWFAPSSQFNDPWDAGGAVSILGGSAAMEASVLKLLFSDEDFAHVSELPDAERNTRIEARLRDVFSVLRFACFSRRYDSNPMWAHYADNHRGACLRFLFTKKLPEGAAVEYSFDAQFAGYYPVRYDPTFAQVGDISDIGSAIQVLHTKHPDWAYEQEVRFIKFGDPKFPGVGGTIPFSKRSLTTVMLGCKVPPAVWRAVEIALDHFGYDDTKLLRADFDQRTQSLKYLEKIRTRRPRQGDAERL